MKNRNIVLLLSAALLVFACNLPSAIAPVADPANDDAPTFTPIPLATATLPGSTVPFASPNSGPLNCRVGPDTSFSVAVILNPGQSAEVVGKNPQGTWWYVKNPLLPGNFCWISAAFATTSGDTSGVAVVATPTNGPGSSSAGAITSIDIFVNPNDIHVGGCIGPIQPITVSAKIESSGAIKIKVHFKDEQVGELPTHTLNFKKADIQDVSDSFTPHIEEGRHKVFLIIEGVDLSGLNAVTSYKITC